MEVALIVAGGKGHRLQLKVLKQFIKIAGLPVLMHTINAFQSYSRGMKTIVVLPGDQLSNWKKLCGDYDFQINHHIVPGGDTRFQSVKNGLQYVEDNDVVAIHDGVRPLVGIDLIRNSFEIARKNGNAIACVPLKESIREISEPGKSASVNRLRFRIIQTPQTFRAIDIKKAYSNNEYSGLTDDASVVEQSGIRINLIQGHYTNIKITTKEDLSLASRLMEEKN